MSDKLKGDIIFVYLLFFYNFAIVKKSKTKSIKLNNRF